MLENAGRKGSLGFAGLEGRDSNPEPPAWQVGSSVSGVPIYAAPSGLQLRYFGANKKALTLTKSVKIGDHEQGRVASPRCHLPARPLCGAEKTAQRSKHKSQNAVANGDADWSPNFLG